MRTDTPGRETLGMDESDWRVDVTDADIRAAREVWESARDAGTDPGRIALLRTDLEGLWRAQAQQFVIAFRGRRTA